MYLLGLTPITGKRGTTSRFCKQLHRLFSATVRCSYTDDSEAHVAGIRLLHRSQAPALVVTQGSRAATSLEFRRRLELRLL